MTLEAVRAAYGVPAHRGTRVEYTAFGKVRGGVITSARGTHLRIRLDGEQRPRLFHPTWCISYLPATTQEE